MVYTNQKAAKHNCLGYPAVADCFVFLHPDQSDAVPVGDNSAPTAAFVDVLLHAHIDVISIHGDFHAEVIER